MHSDPDMIPFVSGHIVIEVDAKRQPLRLLYGFSDFELGEDFGVSSHDAGISSDFTLLGSIHKLEVLCSFDLYTGKRCQKPVLGCALLTSKGLPLRNWDDVLHHQ